MPAPPATTGRGVGGRLLRFGADRVILLLSPRMLDASARDSWQVLTDRLGALIVLETGQRQSCATDGSCAATVVNSN